MPVPPQLAGFVAEILLKDPEGSSMWSLQEAEVGVELLEPVLNRSPRHRPPILGIQTSTGNRRLGLRALDSLGLVKYHSVEVKDM